MANATTVTAPSIVPFGEEHLDGAAALLAERHRAQRLVEPGLDPRYEDPGAARREIEELLPRRRRLGCRRRARRRGGRASCSGGRARRPGARTSGSTRPGMPPSAGARPRPLRRRRGPLGRRRPHLALRDGPGHRPRPRRRMVPARVRPPARPRDPGDSAGRSARRGAARARAAPRARATTSTRSRDSISCCPSTRRSLPSSRACRCPTSRMTRAEYEEDFDDPRFTTFVVERDGEVIALRDRVPDRGLVDAQEPRAPAGRRLPRLRGGVPRAPRLRRGTPAGRGGHRLGAGDGPPVGRHRLAHDQPPRVAGLAAARVPPDLLPAVPRDPLAPPQARRTKIRTVWPCGANTPSPSSIPVVTSSSTSLPTSVDRSTTCVDASANVPSRENAASIRRPHGRGRRHDVDLEHGVGDVGPRQLPSALRAQPPHVREEMRLGVLRHPVGLEHRGTETIEVGDGGRRRGNAPAALVVVPASPHTGSVRRATSTYDARRCPASRSTPARASRSSRSPTTRSCSSRRRLSTRSPTSRQPSSRPFATRSRVSRSGPWLRRRPRDRRRAAARAAASDRAGRSAP